MKHLVLPGKDKLKFVVMGSGKTMCYFIKLLLEKKFPKPAVITHPYKEHERDRSLFYSSPITAKGYEDIFDIVKKENLKIIETKDLNREEILKWLKKQNVNAAFSFGCRSIIKKNFLNSLNRLVFNCHASDLPKDRGGGGPSWRILNDETYVYVVIHLVEERIDSGDIIIKKKHSLKKKRPYPIDILIETIDLAEEVLKLFINGIIQRKSFKLVRQNLEEGTYFPRLFTEKNGAINWFWQTKEIEKFIRAFGHPYSGSWTFLNGRKIIIGRCRLPRNIFKFHPYICGLIFRKYRDGSVEVATKDGSLIVVSIREGVNERPAATRCKVGARFFTPLKLLEESLIFKPVW